MKTQHRTDGNTATRKKWNFFYFSAVPRDRVLQVIEWICTWIDGAPGHAPVRVEFTTTYTAGSMKSPISVRKTRSNRFGRGWKYTRPKRANEVESRVVTVHVLRCRDKRPRHCWAVSRGETYAAPSSYSRVLWTVRRRKFPGDRAAVHINDLSVMENQKDAILDHRCFSKMFYPFHPTPNPGLRRKIVYNDVFRAHTLRCMAPAAKAYPDFFFLLWRAPKKFSVSV